MQGPQARSDAQDSSSDVGPVKALQQRQQRWPWQRWQVVRQRLLLIIQHLAGRGGDRCG